MGSRDQATREVSDPGDASETIAIGHDSPSSADAERKALPPPARIGRFVVIDEVGRGGMGIVYSGYDPELDRRVAIKIVRVDRGTRAQRDKQRQRLVREAQAMAKLSHPNIVPVFEVGTHEGQVFIAMEYVEGTTLRRWLETEPAWPEVLAVLAEAGRGLAAAHRAGVIHRDFKPDNVLVGRDSPRVVKVADFGLAQAVSSTPTEGGLAAVEASSSGSSLRMSSELGSSDAALTEAGTVVGTPRFMAPEQLAGSRVDTAADQFSFCVTAWRALLRTAPFAGRSQRALLQAIRTQPPIEPSSSPVPQRIRRALIRGLSPSPEDRWPDVDALLEALTHDPSVARRRWLSLGGAVVVTGGVVAALGGVGDDEPLCEVTAERWDGVWDDARRQTVSSALEDSGKSYAALAAQQVRDRLDAYTGQWTESYREACEATHVRKEQSTQLLDMRVACLQSAHDDVRHLVDALQTADGAVVERAAAATSALPELSRCADIERLQSETPLPSDPAVRDEVERLQREYSKARALHATGQYRSARTIAEEALESAEGLGHDPILARLLAARGQSWYRDGGEQAAIEVLERAYLLAHGSGDDKAALSAASTLANAYPDLLDRPDDGVRWARLALADAKRGGLSGTRTEASLRYSLGQALRVAGDFEQGFEELEFAKNAFVKFDGPRSRAVANALQGIAAAKSDLLDNTAALLAMEESISIAREQYGDDHPKMGNLLNSLGAIYFTNGRNDEAIQTLLKAEETFVAMQSNHPALLLVYTNLAATYQRSDRLDDAREVYEKGVAIAATSGNRRGESALFHNLAAMHQDDGDLVRAVEYYQRCVTSRQTYLDDSQPDLARSRVELGRALFQLDRNEEGFEAIEAGYAGLVDNRSILAPERTATKAFWAQALARVGRFDEAKETLEAALQEMLDGTTRPEVREALQRRRDRLQRQSRSEPAFYDDSASCGRAWERFARPREVDSDELRDKAATKCDPT